MKEIDFLPEWYKSGRRRQMSYRTQYAALACIFVVMLVWNFLTARSVSQAKAELAQEKVRQAQAKNAAEEFTKVRNAVIKLRQ